MKKRIQRLIVGAVLFAIALLVPAEPTALKFAAYLAAYLVIGYQVLRKALNNIKRGKIFDENFLMAVASVGAFVIGEYPEAVAVMLFYQVGELFEDYAVGKSRKSITEQISKLRAAIPKRSTRTRSRSVMSSSSSPVKRCRWTASFAAVLPCWIPRR